MLGGFIDPPGHPARTTPSPRSRSRHPSHPGTGQNISIPLPSASTKINQKGLSCQTAVRPIPPFVWHDADNVRSSTPLVFQPDGPDDAQTSEEGKEGVHGVPPTKGSCACFSSNPPEVQL